MAYTKTRKDSYHFSLGADPAPSSASSASSAVQDLVKSDVVTTGSAVALIYHGYKRTGSIVWALLYGLAGKKIPVVAVPVAVAQGFGKTKRCTTE